MLEFNFDISTLDTEDKEDLYSSICRIMSSISEQYPYLQVVASPKGPITIRIGEGLSSDELKIFGIIGNFKHNIN